MVALNVTFSDEEMDELRAVAAQLDTSLKTLVRDSVLSAVRNRKHLVEQMATEVATTSAELNRRLA
ncbi:hypothetical protein [Herbiconiux solani]|uniref:hypothetical protein n=1 Tax=Herbiconiux solani TaxID=661329 RepID=UPI0008260E75|nr:hypothetical protein [Herbiconiux solani]